MIIYDFLSEVLATISKCQVFIQKFKKGLHDLAKKHKLFSNILMGNVVLGLPSLKLPIFTDPARFQALVNFAFCQFSLQLLQPFYSTTIYVFTSRFAASLQQLCRYWVFQGFALWWYLHFEELFEIDCKKIREIFFFEIPNFFLPKTFP